MSSINSVIKMLIFYSEATHKFSYFIFIIYKIIFNHDNVY